MKLVDKIKAWLFPLSVEGFKLDAEDKDNDGLVQEGTPFEREVKVVKKAAAKKKPATKKAPAKKTPAAKKTTVKKTAPKKK